MSYRFIPNAVVKEMFGTTETSYVGEGMMPLLESVIGKANYDRYMVAQDPLCDGKTEGDIDII